MKTQTDNPSAPDYDWQADREWFNQRLANVTLRNSHLHNRIVALRAALAKINSPKAKAALKSDTEHHESFKNSKAYRETQ